MFKRRLILSALMLALSGPALAGGSTGGATEVTQVMNNMELMASVSKQSQLVAGQIRDYASQVNQYMTMVQNLKNLPAKVISETLAPYKDTIRSLGELYQASRDVYTTTTEAHDTLQRRRAEMEALKLSPTDYLNAEMLLAQTKGGIYMQQVQRDLKAFEDAQKKSEKLASMGEQVKSIGGNVEGLALLAQMNQAQVGELMELNSQLREKSLEDKQAKVRNEAAKEDKIKKDAEALARIKLQQQAAEKSLMEGSYEGEKKLKEVVKGL
jgi:P-type conjugative transfer protein TrbJ